MLLNRPSVSSWVMTSPSYKMCKTSNMLMALGSCSTVGGRQEIEQGLKAPAKGRQEGHGSRKQSSQEIRDTGSPFRPAAGTAGQAAAKHTVNQECFQARALAKLQKDITEATQGFLATASHMGPLTPDSSVSKPRARKKKSSATYGQCELKRLPCSVGLPGGNEEQPLGSKDRNDLQFEEASLDISEVLDLQLAHD